MLRVEPYRRIGDRILRPEVAVVLLSMVAGAVAAGSTFGVGVRPIATSWLLPLGALAVAVLVGVRRPLLLYGALFAWFPLSDLLRKYSVGGVTLVFGRDVLLVLATVLLAVHFREWRGLRAAFRRAWPAFLMCAGYFAVTGVSSFFIGWQVPLSALRLYFGFMPLMVVGYYIGLDDERLGRFARFAAVLLSGVALVGILQAVVNPNFLNPASAGELFSHLGLYRTTSGLKGDLVFQPSGVFVETGRNTNWCFVTFAFGVALLQVRRLGVWRFPVVLIGTVGLIVASARGVLIAAGALVVLNLLVRVRFDPRRVLRVGIPAVGGLLTIVLVLGLFFPGLIASRAEFLGLSLNPFSESSEISTRGPGYLYVTAKAAFIGGIFGRGLGLQSLGVRYLQSVASYETFAEGGFVTIAVETGALGLVLWLVWVIQWLRTLFRFRHTATGENISFVTTIACSSTVLLFIPFWLGISAIQDFVTNSAFFFGSGIAAGLSFGRMQRPVSVKSSGVATHQSSTSTILPSLPPAANRS